MRRMKSSLLIQFLSDLIMPKNLSSNEIPKGTRRSIWRQAGNSRSFAHDILGEMQMISELFTNNSSTSITYTLPTQSPVTLRIYNIRGQLIDVLLDRVMPAGRHSVVWDGSNLSSSLYLVRMKANNKKYVQKLILIE